ncbi:MAG: hypothetical protein JKY48_04895 [Flavobacteriales bacterium]|nr:hypothetical protein [Flavobacteriales bacterium]
MLIIEHNSELIKPTDCLINLGPERGENSGELVFEGTVAEMLKNKKLVAAKYLM